MYDYLSSVDMPNQVKDPSKTRMRARQEQFCLEYLKDFDRIRAYKAAGYKPKNNNVAKVQAFRLLEKPHIQEFLAKEVDARKERLRIDADWITKKFVDIIENPETKDSDVISSLKEVARHVGYYEKDNEQSKPDLSGLDNLVASMSIDELVKIAGGASKRDNHEEST